MRILFVYAGLFFGSAWAVCKHVIKGVDPAAFQIYIAANAQSPGNFEIDASRAVIRRLALRLDGGGARKVLAAATLGANVVRLAALVRRERIDVIHTNEDANSALIGLALKATTGRPLVVHYHTIPDLYASPRREVMKRIARVADCNVGVSRFVAEEITKLGVPERRVAVAVNGVDVQRFNPSLDGSAVRREYGIGSDQVLAVVLARVAQEKRQEDFIRALAAARRAEPRLRGMIVGWDDPRYDGRFGSYREELTALAAREGVRDALVMDKARNDAPLLHAAADLTVLPSPAEPFGLVVAEAMATGKPVIGARAGGIPEIIDDGVTGYLVPPRDPAALAEKLVELARSPELRARMGRAGREAACGRFSPAHVATQFEAIYRRVASRA